MDQWQNWEDKIEEFVRSRGPVCWPRPPPLPIPSPSHHPPRLADGGINTSNQILLPLRFVPAERRRLLLLPRFCWDWRSTHPNSALFLLLLVGHSLFIGCASMDTESNAMPVNTSEGMELKEGKDLLVKCKRTKFSVSIVQPQQGVEVSDMENKMPDVLLHKVSAGKDPMNRLTDSALQSNGNESARSRLPKICSASGWKEPLYDFEEQGPPHNKLFTCKVTVHVEGIVNTILECFGDPKSQKKAAQEHAARGAMWFLAHYGHVK